MAWNSYSPDYDLERRALVYRCALEAPRPLPARSRHGSQSQPSLRITAHPAQLTVEVEHHYTSGHAWMIDDDRDLLLATADPADPALADLLPPSALQALQALLADADRWRPAVLAEQFTRYLGTSPDPVYTPEDGDTWELGRSRTLDGRLPYLTLRLTPTGREIVLDHSFSGPLRQRRLEPVHVPATDADIVACFGADVLAAAQRLAGG